MPSKRLVKGFSVAGETFANQLRLNVPPAVLGTSAEQTRARAALRKDAQDTTLKLQMAARQWLNDPKAILAAVAQGQRLAAQQIGTVFDGPNQALIDRLRQDIARDLSAAAHSTLPFVDQTLRKATAIATIQLHRQSSETVAAEGLSDSISRSLLAGSLAPATRKDLSDRLLKDLGLAEGDKVLFISGRQMDAEAYAELVTRTRVIEALNLGKASQMIQGGFLYIETSQHEGVDPKDICYELQGRVWALGPNELGIPVLPPEYGLPPWHPNCGHTFGAWQPSMEGGDSAVAGVLADHLDDDKSLEKWQGKTYIPAKA